MTSSSNGGKGLQQNVTVPTNLWTTPQTIECSTYEFNIRCGGKSYRKTNTYGFSTVTVIPKFAYKAIDFTIHFIAKIVEINEFHMQICIKWIKRMKKLDFPPLSSLYDTNFYLFLLNVANFFQFFGLCVLSTKVTHLFVVFWKLHHEISKKKVLIVCSKKKFFLKERWQFV